MISRIPAGGALPASGLAGLLALAWFPEPAPPARRGGGGGRRGGARILREAGTGEIYLRRLRPVNEDRRGQGSANPVGLGEVGSPALKVYPDHAEARVALDLAVNPIEAPQAVHGRPVDA